MVSWKMKADDTGVVTRMEMITKLKNAILTKITLDTLCILLNYYFMSDLIVS